MLIGEDSDHDFDEVLIDSNDIVNFLDHKTDMFLNCIHNFFNEMMNEPSLEANKNSKKPTLSD